MSRNTIKKSNTIRNPHAIQAQSTKSGRNACTKQPGNIEPGEGPIGPIPSARIVPGPRSSGHCSNPTSQILRPLSAVDRHTIQPIQTNPAFTVQLVPAASLPRPVPASCSNTRATGTRASSILAILPILLPSPIPLQSRCNHGIPS